MRDVAVNDASGEMARRVCLGDVTIGVSSFPECLLHNAALRCTGEGRLFLWSGVIYAALV